MEKKLYLVKKEAARKGSLEKFIYLQLYVDLGYTTCVVSMDKDVISNLLDKRPSELYNGEVDVPVLVGTLDLQPTKPKKAE